MTVIHNLLRDLPPDTGAEVFEPLLRRPGLRLERIVSRGQATPPGDWYDQTQDEWILLLAGEARAAFIAVSVEQSPSLAAARERLASFVSEGLALRPALSGRPAGTVPCRG